MEARLCKCASSKLLKTWMSWKERLRVSFTIIIFFCQSQIKTQYVTLPFVDIKDVMENTWTLIFFPCLDVDLPVSLLKDLLPHLNIYYLDRIETAAASKGTVQHLQYIQLHYISVCSSCDVRASDGPL